MKITLILPYDSTYKFRNGSFKKSILYPPLTLTILASLVPEELNAEIRIIDEGVEEIEDNLDSDLVGISAVTANAPRAYYLADKIREKGIPVILGGVHPTILPEEAAKHADSVVLGFAEQSWPQLLRDFKAGIMKKFYNIKPGMNLSKLPFPRRDLLKKKKYITINTIMATRGCPHKCHFCSLPVVRQGQYYKRPVEDVIAEIKFMKTNKLIFLDPSPTEDVNYIGQLYKAMVPLNIKWVGLTTVNMVENDELLSLAVKSGCMGLLIGFESISQQALHSVGKDFNLVSRYKDLIQKMHDNGIGVLACMVFGFDDDDKSTFERTLEFVDKTRIDLLRYTIYTPFPGTVAYRNLKQEGRIIENDWARYDYEHVVFKPAKMSSQELQDGVTWLWKHTYSFKSILKKAVFEHRLPLITIPANIGFKYHAKQLAESYKTEKNKYAEINN